MKKLIVFLVLLAFVLVSVPVMAASMTLSWDAPALNCDESALTDLAGFTVWWGNTPRPSGVPPTCGAPDETVYLNSFMVGPADTQAVLSVFDMEIERTLYISVTAFDSYGNQSHYADELVWFVPPTMVAPGIPTNLRVVAGP